jgi:hypothetical protein
MLISVSGQILPECVLPDGPVSIRTLGWDEPKETTINTIDVPSLEEFIAKVVQNVVRPR